MRSAPLHDDPAPGSDQGNVALADDPTRALDGFATRLRNAAPPMAPAEDPTSLAKLQARLHLDRAAAAAVLARGGSLRPRQAWAHAAVTDVIDAIDVIDLASIRLPELPVSAGVDAAALDDTLRQASAGVSARFRAEAQAAAAPAWQPDPQALQLRRARHPRLLAAWQPGAWVGALREVIGPATEFVTSAGGTVVETYAAQRLLLRWPPQRLDQPGLPRWPQRAWLTDLPDDLAAEALLDGLPADARLWLHGGPPQAIDWALAAELVLTHEPALRPFQATGLRGFIDAEREASYAWLNRQYQHAPGGARLR